MAERKYIRTLTIIFYLYLFAEGVLRKWIMPSVPGVFLYSIKYIFLILLSLSYLRHRNYIVNAGTVEAYKIQSGISIYLICIIISAVIFTVLYNGPIVASITLIQYVSPIILIYILPFLIIDKQSLRSIEKIFLIITICVLILGFIQYFSSPYAPINRYAVELKNGIAKVGEAARICSVFSYITPLGDFCILAGTFLLSLAIIPHKTIRSNMVLTSVLILTIVVAFMTGSRSVIILLFSSLIFVIFKESFVNGNFKLLGAVVFIGFCICFYYSNVGILAIDNFIERASSANDTNVRITKLIDYNRMTNYAGWFGYGIGIANLSVQNMLTTKSELGFEEEIGRIVIEFGIIGFIIISFIKLYIWSQMLKMSRNIFDKKLSLLSWSTLIVITPMTFYIQLCLYNWFAYIIYFSMIGFNIALSNIDKGENGSIYS